MGLPKNQPGPTTVAVTCRWCTDGSCMICQLGQSAAAIEEGGIRSPAGDLTRIAELGAGSPPMDWSLDDCHSYSNAFSCHLCGKRYKDMFLHYAKSHPEARAPEFSKGRRLA